MMGESSGHENLESMLKDGRSEQRNLPLEYLRDITDNFCDERRLGKGGFGTVYKGVLENGEEIAIKKLNTSMLETMDREFENEVKHLTRLKHPNVVVLVGWCSEAENTYVKYKGKYVCAEKQQRLLCFEYMPKGDLRGYLSDASSGLGWDTRYKIIEGICYGLCHLHEGCQPNATIVHMDLKPENILLDNNMMPKIADFGLSRLFDVDKIWKITSSRGGTLGYMSREYIHNGRISTKSDIFSLGVIIIEIVTGHRDYPDDTGTPSKEFIEMVLHNWSQRKRIKNIFGLSLEVDYEQIRRCIQIGLDCVHTDWSRRPTISQIIKALHGQGSADSPAVPRKTSGGLIPTDRLDSLFSPRCVWVNGPIIVGAGPSGLAVAACLREQGVPYVILERADCIASRWQKRTYDRLKLHLPKQFHELPRMPFPDHYPEYPTRRQFIDYLQDYASMFEIKPEFSTTVKSARYDETSGLWRVVTSAPYISGEMEYIGRWLVVATGENAESVVPDIPGLDGFDGKVTHVSDYKSGEAYAGKRVLVVGCGNSGMEVSLDLSDHGARPAMVVRDAVHVLPRAVLGTSTFKLAVLLMRWLPLWIVDKIMVLLAWLVLGNLAKLGLRRPAAGPFELMLKHGRTPVLDYSTVGCIRAGYIAVVPAITRFGKGGQVELVDGRTLNFDAVILATGYRSNVPQWLQGNDFFNKDGFPKTSLSGDGDEGRRGLFSASAGWKGQSRLYAVGFTRRGLSSASADAVRVAKDLGNVWREETKPTKRARACHRRCIQQVF